MSELSSYLARVKNGESLTKEDLSAISMILTNTPNACMDDLQLALRDYFVSKDFLDFTNTKVSHASLDDLPKLSSAELDKNRLAYKAHMEKSQPDECGHLYFRSVDISGLQIRQDIGMFPAHRSKGGSKLSKLVSSGRDKINNFKQFASKFISESGHFLPKDSVTASSSNKSYPAHANIRKPSINTRVTSKRK